MKRVAKVFEVLFLVLMIAICAIVLMAGQGNVPYIFGHRILQVMTDSMSPTISDKTCIIIKQVEQEDIITFTSQDPRIKGYLNTHRVCEIVEDSETGEKLYITMGDAATDPDPYPVSYEQIAGVYVRELPFGKELYRMIYFLADQVNYFVVVMLPLFICFMSYLRQLLKALFSKEMDADADE